MNFNRSFHIVGTECKLIMTLVDYKWDYEYFIRRNYFLIFMLSCFFVVSQIIFKFRYLNSRHFFFFLRKLYLLLNNTRLRRKQRLYDKPSQCCDKKCSLLIIYHRFAVTKSKVHKLITASVKLFIKINTLLHRQQARIEENIVWK